MVEKKKVYTRYLVIKIGIEVDATQTDQNPDDHIIEISDSVFTELNYDVSFDGNVESGDDCLNAIDIPVKIVNTELMGFTDTNPC